MKPRVLMIAYACDPEGGGEHWLGWGWAEQAAHNYEIELITTPKARLAIEKRSRDTGITPHFVETPASVQKLTEATGGSWWRKLAWQKRVLRLAEELHKTKPFQIVHQTTFHTFRVPFLSAGLGIPSVWGPIAGGERVPHGFEKYLGSSRYSEASRNVINRFWLHLPAIKRSLAQTSVIFASNRVTQRFLPANCLEKSQIVPPNALRPEDEQQVPPATSLRANSSTFRLLYVGNCVATRAMPIVFEALHQSGLSNYELTIVGDGPALPSWKQRATASGLTSKLKFAGKIPYSQLADRYREADALVFPALRDSGGSALLEAMARFVPVVCFDWAGPGEMIDKNSGVKISVLEPAATVSELARGLAALAADPDRRAALAASARARAQAVFRWQAKRDLLEATYQRLIAN